MIKNIILRKGIVVIILLLFIGSLIIPSSFGKIGDKRFHSDSSGVPPKKEWELQLTFYPRGEGNWVEQTADGGFIITGATWHDVLLIKTDSNGQVEWNRTYNGSEPRVGYTVHQTNDGGYIIIGRTVTVHGNYNNSLLIKTDKMGNEQWHRVIGGINPDRTLSGQQTNDSGFIMTGSTVLNGTKDSIWLLKTNNTGIEQWNKTYGQGLGSSVQQTTDKGYIITGNTWGFMTPSDIILVKTDFYGNLEWNKTYGTPYNNYGSSVQQTTDDGYVVFGISYQGEIPPAKATAFLIKTDSLGNEVWNKTYGDGIDSDTQGYSVSQTKDQGYIMTGTLASVSIPGWYNLWLLRTDSSGNKIWERTFDSGNLYYDLGNAVQQTNDGGYIIVGNRGEEAIWLIKITPESPLKPTFIIGKISEPAVHENYTIVNTYRTFCIQLFPLKIKYFHSQEEIIIANTHIGILKNNTIFGVFKAHI